MRPHRSGRDRQDAATTLANIRSAMAERAVRPTRMTVAAAGTDRGLDDRALRALMREFARAASRTEDHP